MTDISSKLKLHKLFIIAQFEKLLQTPKTDFDAIRKYGDISRMDYS